MTGWSTVFDGNGTINGRVESILDELNGHKEMQYKIANTSANRYLISQDLGVTVDYSSSEIFKGIVKGASYEAAELTCNIYDECYEKMQRKIITGTYSTSDAASVLSDICTAAGVTAGECTSGVVSVRFDHALCFDAGRYLAQALGKDFWSGKNLSGNVTFNVGDRDGGLVGCWLFDEGSGVVALDSSVHHNSGAITTTFNSGTITGASWVAGRTGGYALNFDGVDDNVEIPDSASLDIGSGSFSICFWMKSSNASRDIMRKVSTKGFAIWQNASNIQCRLYTPAAVDILNGANPSTGIWHFCVVTINKTSGYGTFYLDTVAGTSVDISGIGDISTTAHFLLGTAYAFAPYLGELSEVQLFNRALTSTEIATLYASGVGSVGGGLVGKWLLNEGSGTVALDTHPWVNGKEGTAGSFNGVDSYVNFGNSFLVDGADRFSISCWASFSNANAGRIVGKETGDFDTPFLIYVVNTFVAFYTSNGAPSEYAQARTSLSYNDGKLHHIVAVYDGAFVRIYVDAVEGVADNWTRGIKNSTELTFIGASMYGGAPFGLFSGVIDDVQVWDRALSADEVSRLYSGTTPVSISSAGVDRSKNRKLVYVRGVDGNGNAIFGQAGSGTDAIVYNKTQASDTATLNKIAESYLKVLNTDSAGSTATLTISQGYDVYAGDILVFTDNFTNMQLGLVGAHRVVRVNKKQDSVDVEVDRAESVIEKKMDEILTDLSSMGIYPIGVDFPIVVNQQGLIGSWSMTEGEGKTIYDSTANRQDGTLVSGVVWVDGVIGGTKVLAFNSGHVDCGDWLNLSGLSTFSIATWFSPMAFGSNQNYLAYQEGRFKLHQYGTSGVMLFSMWLNGGWRDCLTTSGEVTVGGREHVVAVYDSSNLQMYVNNVLVKSAVTSGVILAASGHLYLGGDGATRFLVGDMAGLQIYNRALSAAEVKDLYYYYPENYAQASIVDTRVNGLLKGYTYIFRKKGDLYEAINGDNGKREFYASGLKTVVDSVLNVVTSGAAFRFDSNSVFVKDSDLLVDVAGLEWDLGNATIVNGNGRGKLFDLQASHQKFKGGKLDGNYSGTFSVVTTTANSGQPIIVVADSSKFVSGQVIRMASMASGSIVEMTVKSISGNAIVFTSNLYVTYNSADGAKAVNHWVYNCAFNIGNSGTAQVTNIEIDNTEFERFEGHCVNIRNASIIDVHDCNVHDTSDYPIHGMDFCAIASGKDMWFHDNYTYHIWGAIDDLGGGVEIMDSQVDAGVTTERIFCYNNHWEKIGEFALAATTPFWQDQHPVFRQYPKDIICEGEVIIDCGYTAAGITTIGNGHMVIKNCEFRIVDTVKAPTRGFWSQGNRVPSPPVFGTYTTLDDNRFLGNGSGNNYLYGILFDGWKDYYIDVPLNFKRNKFYNCNIGVQVTYANGFDIYENEFYDCSNGIYLDGCNDGDMERNKFNITSGTISTGIHFEGSIINLVKDNNFAANVTPITMDTSGNSKYNSYIGNTGAGWIYTTGGGATPILGSDILDSGGTSGFINGNLYWNYQSKKRIDVVCFSGSTYIQTVYVNGNLRGGGKYVTVDLGYGDTVAITWISGTPEIYTTTIP